jgi:integrase
VRGLVKELGDQGKGVTANRVAALIGRVYRFARRELDIAVLNPAEALQSTYAERSKDRVLDRAEFATLLAALRDPASAPVSLSAGMALCLQLCAVSLQRAGEVAGIRRDEIQMTERLWVLPADRSKNKREHLVPLSEAALEIIDRAERLAGDSAFLFPSPRRGPEHADQPITRHAVTRAMARLMDGLGLKRAGPHDLRRTGATWITSEQIGLPRFYVSHVLGHVSETGGVTSVYDRNSYLREKRDALERLAVCLTKLDKD